MSNSSHVPTPNERGPIGNIPSLTGFRGFAALIVLLNHAGQFAGLEDFLPVKYGYFGVPCFFCLSGALFALLYFETATTTSEFLGPYYWARFIRIFPVYWLILAIYALTVSPVDWAALGWHIVMGHGFIGQYRDAINVPMWTLPVECGFYLLAPWVFVAMRWLQKRFAPSGSASGYRYLVHIVSLLLFSVGLGVIGFVFHLFAPDDFNWWKGTIFGRFFQFGLGILTGLLLADLKAGVIRLPRSAGNWLVLAAIGIAVMQVTAIELTSGRHLEGPARLLYFSEKLSLGVTACLLIFAAVANSLWQRFLSSRALVFFGAISYALYLLQCASFGSVLGLSEVSANRFAELGFNPWLNAATTSLICIGAATLVHYGFEAPIQQWLRRRLVRRVPG